MIKEKTILELNKIGAIKFGEFTLKSGLISPYYFDFRFLCSYPKILRNVAKVILGELKRLKLKYDLIAAVPYCAIPIASAMALEAGQPMIYTRKEAKDYGTKKMVEGSFKKGQTAVVIDDVISDGASKLEAIGPLQNEGIKVKDVFVIVDRGQGGPTVLKKKGFNCHSLATIDEVIAILKKHNKITEEQARKARRFMLLARNKSKR